MMVVIQYTLRIAFNMRFSPVFQSGNKSTITRSLILSSDILQSSRRTGMRNISFEGNLSKIPLLKVNLGGGGG